MQWTASEPTYTCYSPLSPAACARRLAGLLQTRGVGSPAPDKPLWGAVEEGRFSFRRASGYRNLFAPHFRGTLRPSGGGTVLQGQFGLLPAAQVGAVIWAAVWVLSTCAGTAIVLGTGLAFWMIGREFLMQLEGDVYQEIVGAFVMMLGFPVLGVLVGLGFPVLFVKVASRDRDRILAELEGALELTHCDVEPGAR